MVLENLEVLHKVFGKGIIVARKDKYITVKFGSAEKVFVYPDSFEKFLTLADGTVSEEIKEDINSSNEAKRKLLDMKNEENERARTRGIVIPGKENLNPELDEEETRYKNTTEQEEV